MKRQIAMVLAALGMSASAMAFEPATVWNKVLECDQGQLVLDVDSQDPTRFQLVVHNERAVQELFAAIAYRTGGLTKLYNQNRTMVVSELRDPAPFGAPGIPLNSLLKVEGNRARIESPSHPDSGGGLTRNWNFGNCRSF